MCMLKFARNLLKKLGSSYILRIAEVPPKEHTIRSPLKLGGKTLYQALYCFLDGLSKVRETNYISRSNKEMEGERK